MARPRTFDDDDVVERAMEAFWTHGYAGTSSTHLAAATGIGKGSLYNAFATKRALFDQALDRYHEHVSAMADDLLDRPGPTRECLAAALRSVVDADLAAPRRRGCLIGNTAVELAGRDPELARRLRAMQDRQVERFATRIRQGQVAGDVRRDLDPRAFAEHLANTLAGLRVMAMTFDAPALHRIVETALAGL